MLVFLLEVRRPARSHATFLAGFAIELLLLSRYRNCRCDACRDRSPRLRAEADVSAVPKSHDPGRRPPAARCGYCLPCPDAGPWRRRMPRPARKFRTRSSCPERGSCRCPASRYRHGGKSSAAASALPRSSCVQWRRGTRPRPRPSRDARMIFVLFDRGSAERSSPRGDRMPLSRPRSSRGRPLLWPGSRMSSGDGSRARYSRASAAAISSGERWASKACASTRSSLVVSSVSTGSHSIRS